MNQTGRDKQALESTIEPVRRPADDRGGVAAAARQSRVGTIAAISAVAVVCVLGLFAVFVYLPARVAETPPSPAAVATAPEAEEDAGPQLTEEELAALTDEAESLLAALLEQQRDLATRAVASWGDTTYSAYENAARLADEAFLAGDLTEAVSRYREAIDTGRQLLARSDQLVSEALAAGDAAIAGGDAGLAASQYAVALEIDPDNAAALRGQQRAAVLTDVVAQTREGGRLEDEGRYAEAVDAYRAALAIDPDFAAARTGLGRAEKSAADQAFAALLADGFAALDGQRFDLAVEVFQAAVDLRPSSEAARNGLDEAVEGQESSAIAMAEIRGRAFERRELWNEAVDRYREALATDPTLKFANDGLERAQRRSDLDTKLEALIASPRMLLTDAVLEDARGLLAEARAIEAPGPRLGSQIEQLDHLVELASTPIDVTLRSDNVTEVAVYQVGELGTFETRALSLKPGTYTATGRRRGYRDVRETFTVLPGTENGPVTVICDEPIDIGSRAR